MFGNKGAEGLVAIHYHALGVCKGTGFHIFFFLVCLLMAGIFVVWGFPVLGTGLSLSLKAV
jgi:hypothetical protein